MARPLGPVRLRRTNYVTLFIGAVLCVFIIYFLTASSSQPSSASRIPTPTRKPTSKSSLIADRPPVRRFNLNNVTITADPIGNREAVLILTPMARFYQEYWDNLLKLQYPHDLITLGFILPKNKEGNAATTALQAQITKTQKGSVKDRFRSVVIERQDFDPPLTSQDEGERHKMQNQKARRASMSRARNSLLFTTLGADTSWVLWLDSDIIETPPTLIQDLAAHDKPIIAPNCYQRYTDPETGKPAERPYDFNNWQDSPTAQEIAAKMDPDDILLEGYSEMATYRALMAYMVEQVEQVHLEVPLDGVGGTALLVKADVHRDGAMFPPFPFYHLIETEGFARMAKRLGWQATGLPNYKVYHYNE
ncbi:glycosyltransferase family 62 protein [Durotheca rogersii]|uniref:glycosyltransferase family 62 protein n=1 Tax=Durotheca rogersii TaxID=419775 RepID=UPI00221F7D49|nr:glycosyltransferase family 62 protein [Durotheca rogersii]KAI5866895.1 glycosyltransferase family 62 protein [Durotheca rogersii]